MTMFVHEANCVIRDTGNSKRVVTVNVTQEGNARLIDIRTSAGKVGLLEVDGRVLLCTYIMRYSQVMRDS